MKPSAQRRRREYWETRQQCQVKRHGSPLPDMETLQQIKALRSELNPFDGIRYNPIAQNFAVLCKRCGGHHGTYAETLQKAQAYRLNVVCPRQLNETATLNPALETR